MTQMVSPTQQAEQAQGFVVGTALEYVVRVVEVPVKTGMHVRR